VIKKSQKEIRKKQKKQKQEAKSKNQTEAAIVLHFATAHSWFLGQIQIH
jgi:hypothetical protein